MLERVACLKNKKETLAKLFMFSNQGSSFLKVEN